MYGINENSEVSIYLLLEPQTSIVIPETIDGMPVVEIGKRAFKYIDAESLYIHKGIESIYSSSFMTGDNDTVSIGTIYYDGSPGMLDSLGAGKLTDKYNVVCNYTPIEGFALVGGENFVTLRAGEIFEPEYEYYPENAEGILSLSYEGNGISIENGNIKGVYTGEATVTVTAESGVQYTFKVMVIGCTGITVEKLPDKVYYGLRQPLDVTGLKIVKEYNDNTSIECEDYTLSAFNPLQRGCQTVTVMCGGYTTSFDVFVSDAELGDINLDGGISSIDSNYLKRVVAGMLQVDGFTDEFFACDINGDGQINAVDSALLKRMIAG